MSETVPELRVVAGDPTAEDLAAVQAVLAAAVQEVSDDSARREGETVSAWQRSQRAMRGPVRPARGAWRGFSG